jgi:hypothetical protein
MVWISFVIVTIIFFTPVIGLSRIVQEQIVEVTIPLPVVGGLSILITGAPLLALCCIVLWGIVWIIFQLLESASVFTLEKMDLRNRFLYATRPYLSNNVALWLSRFALAITTPIATVQFARPIVELVFGLYLGEVAKQLTDQIFSSLGEAVGSLVGQTALQVILSFLNTLLGFKFDLGIVVLGVLVVVASSRFHSEQTFRYAADRHRNRIARKNQQTDIIVPQIGR